MRKNFKTINKNVPVAIVAVTLGAVCAALMLAQFALWCALPQSYLGKNMLLYTLIDFLLAGASMVTLTCIFAKRDLRFCAAPVWLVCGNLLITYLSQLIAYFRGGSSGGNFFMILFSCLSVLPITAAAIVTAISSFDIIKSRTLTVVCNASAPVAFIVLHGIAGMSVAGYWSAQLITYLFMLLFFCSNAVLFIAAKAVPAGVSALAVRLQTDSVGECNP